MSSSASANQPLLLGNRRPRSSSRVRRYTVRAGYASPFKLENVLKPLAVGALVTLLIHLLNCYLNLTHTACPF